ncbi:MAG: putative permease [Anaerocolumna sp.]|nr:putative permease [Anaerocolumna sp.]
MTHKISAFKIYITYSAFTAFLFSLVFTVNMVYYVDVIHLNPFQLVLIGTVLEATCFICEIPTGIVADIYSRKLSVIIGVALIGCGFVLEGAITSFISVLVSQFLWGLGYTFISGAIDAWIVTEDKTRNIDEIYLKGTSWGNIGSIIGIGFSTIIGNYSLRLPILLGGICFVLFALFLIVFMPEYHFNYSSNTESNNFRKMKTMLITSLETIKKKHIVMMLLSVSLLNGLASEGYDRLYTIHFLKDTTFPKLGNLQPVTWFGLFSMIAAILSITIIQFILKGLEKKKHIENDMFLLIINIGSIICITTFALSSNFTLMAIAYLVSNLLRSLNEPIYHAWINKHIDDNGRATILSTKGILNSFGQIIGGPGIGFIATVISIKIGILGSAILLIPTIFIFILIRDRKSA